MERILVGVDASDSSVAALGQAADEARRTGATLEVAHVIAPPEAVTAFPVPPGMGRDEMPNVEAEREKAEERLGEWLDGLEVDLSDVDVELTVIADRRPSRALVERSRAADLVVVGSRGRGGFSGLLLGSVSEQVTRHAKCPVLVVRQSTS